jgi:hypothetical protein
MLNFLLENESTVVSPTGVTHPASAQLTPSEFFYAPHSPISEAVNTVHYFLYHVIFPLFQQSSIFSSYLKHVQPEADETSVETTADSDNEFEVIVRVNPRHHPLEENLDDETLVSDSSVAFATPNTARKLPIPLPGALQQLLRECELPVYLRMHRRVVTPEALNPKTDTAQLILCAFTRSTDLVTTIVGQPCYITANDHSEEDLMLTCSHSASLFCPLTNAGGQQKQMHNFVAGASTTRSWYGCSYVVRHTCCSCAPQVPSTGTGSADGTANETTVCNELGFNTLTGPEETRAHVSSWSPVMRRFRNSLSGISNQFTGLAGHERFLHSQNTEDNVDWYELQPRDSVHDHGHKCQRSCQQASVLMKPPTTEHNDCHGIALLSNSPALMSLRLAMQPLLGMRAANTIENTELWTMQTLANEDSDQRCKQLYTQLSSAIKQSKSLQALSETKQLNGSGNRLAADIDFNILASIISPRLLATLLVSMVLEYKIVMISHLGNTALTMVGEFMRHAVLPLR